MNISTPTLTIHGDVAPTYDAELGPGTAIYRLFSEGDELLYIGIANNPLARWSQHTTTAAWWPCVRRCDVVWFTTRREALTAEAHAIRKERPLHNDVHNYAARAGRQPGWSSEVKARRQKIRYATTEAS